MKKKKKKKKKTACLLEYGDTFKSTLNSVNKSILISDMVMNENSMEWEKGRIPWNWSGLNSTMNDDSLMTEQNMKQNKIWEQLPRALLHYREEWLSSLSSLAMTETPNNLTKVVYGAPYDKKYTISYYQWLGSRKVLVRNKFPVRPVRWPPSEKHGKGYARVDSVLYTTLSNQLQANTLKKLRVLIRHSDELVCSEIENLLRKHMNSLQELVVYDDSHGPEYVGWSHIFKCLIQSRHALCVLDVWMQRVRFDNRKALLLEYLSLAGMSLKILKFGYRADDFVSNEELLKSIGTSCPKLESLLMDTYGGSFVTRPSIIYHLCPNLKSFSEVSFKLEADEMKNSVNLDIRILLHEERGQYDQVGLTLSHSELTNDEWSVMKSKVGGKLTSVSAAISGDILVDLLKENPRLQVLKVNGYNEERIELSNRSLSTIAEYVQNLIELTITMRGEAHFTDEMISHMIRRCTKLEVLHIPDAGCESILCAAQYLPRLRERALSAMGEKFTCSTILILVAGKDTGDKGCIVKQIFAVSRLNEVMKV
eukprot:scaffold686_cov177-Ochromonas_danica.AAC.19